MTIPILTIGDLEPERRTVAIRRNAPDGPWQRWKFAHLDVLLRWMPVRFAQRVDHYELRRPSEFGLRNLARMRAMQSEIDSLRGDPTEAAGRRIAVLLRSIVAIVLDAPSDVLDALHPAELLAILEVFPAAATGQTPTKVRSENPSTSGASSPSSATSTRAPAGTTG
jgi:hypothetical protein